MIKILAGGQLFSSKEAGSNPTDPSGAVGPQHFVATCNWMIGLFDKKFNRLAAMRGRAFFGHGGEQFDSHVTYSGDRFWIIGITPVGLSVAKSKSSQPLTLTASDWDVFYVPMTGTDYPMVTPHQDGILVTFATPNDKYLTIRGDKTYVFAPNSVTTGAWHPAAGWTIQMATNPWRLRLRKPGDQTITDISINPIKGASGATQPSGPIPTGQPESNAMACKDRLVFCYANGSELHWYVIQIGTALPTLETEGVVTEGFNPSIGINDRGDIALCYCRSTSTEYLSVIVRGRTGDDLPGVLRPPVVVKQSDCNYRHRYRFGDFASMSVDADGTFYATNIYASDTDMNPNQDTNWQMYGVAFELYAPALELPFTVTIDGKLFEGKGAWK